MLLAPKPLEFPKNNRINNIVQVRLLFPIDAFKNKHMYMLIQVLQKQTSKDPIHFSRSDVLEK